MLVVALSCRPPCAGSKVTMMMRMCDVTLESWHVLSRETSSSSKTIFVLNYLFVPPLWNLKICLFRSQPRQQRTHNRYNGEGRSCLFKQWMRTTLGDQLNFTRSSALTLQSKLGHKYSTHHIDWSIAIFHHPYNGRFLSSSLWKIPSDMT